ncbi:MAG TPA: hypothetical protein VM715_09135, partial [Candidatus Acidoferrum sp.]|nr:hypothetical protein [Candidatus Acidoferrum sp.]
VGVGVAGWNAMVLVRNGDGSARCWVLRRHLWGFAPWCVLGGRSWSGRLTLRAGVVVRGGGGGGLGCGGVLSVA